VFKAPLSYHTYVCFGVLVSRSGLHFSVYILSETPFQFPRNADSTSAHFVFEVYGNRNEANHIALILAGIAQAKFLQDISESLILQYVSRSLAQSSAV
jgi:hypothetical protein